VLELLRSKYPDRNRDGRHRLQIFVVTGYSNDGEFSSRLHQMDADVFVNKASLSRPGHLPDQIRRALAKAGRADHAACAPIATAPAAAVAEAPLTGAAEAAAVEGRRPPLASARVRLGIDGRRSGRRVGLLVSGVRVRLPDQHFLYLLRLVVEHLRGPQAWHTMGDLGFANNVVLPSRLRRALRPVVPEGFVVLEKNGTKLYRLNPEIVIEHVDWRAMQEDEDLTLARVAREGARLDASAKT
jgi:hypothetical protein